MKPIVEFGLGLVSLGRHWGFQAADLPGPNQVRQLLETAVLEGVRVFDTAPSYGVSEEALGDFLRQLSPAVLENLVISTKAGELWDAEAQAPIVNHSYDGLRRSIDRSFQRLPRLTVLQVHRPTVQILQKPEVLRVLQEARKAGIQQLGASVSDVDTGRYATQCGVFDLIQFPYHSGSTHLAELFDIAGRHGLAVWVNRPFGMGRLLYNASGDAVAHAVEDAYCSVLAKAFGGAILTGTRSPAHLVENLAAFRSVINRPRTAFVE